MQISCPIGRYTSKIIMLGLFWVFLVLFCFFSPSRFALLCQGEKILLYVATAALPYLSTLSRKYILKQYFFKKGFLKPRDKVCSLPLSKYKLLNSYHRLFIGRGFGLHKQANANFLQGPCSPRGTRKAMFPRSGNLFHIFLHLDLIRELRTVCVWFMEIVYSNGSRTF